MRPAALAAMTAAAMVAFAANSLLCRLALRHTTIDPVAFTFIRIGSGAVALLLLATLQRPRRRGNWGSAFALFAYAAGFSLAYVRLGAAVGALLLFASVQATMILWGLRKGERLHAVQIAGLALAMGGLVFLLLPGISAPPIDGTMLMVGAGVAWGIYSVRGKSEADPAGATTGNFVRALLFAAALTFVLRGSIVFDRAGAVYAVISGALASGGGYILWYFVLSSLTASTAATVQLSVPVLAAAGAILLLDEPLTLRFLLASAAVLGGIGIFLATKQAR